MMSQKIFNSFFVSCAFVIGYIAFTVLALARYPQDFSPVVNWLSDLGSSVQNPDGAIFYNIGIVLTGVLLVVFFLGISQLRIASNRIQNAMVRITQAFGVLGALAMVSSAAYPIDAPGMHSFFSAALYILLGTAFGFSVAALRYYPTCPRWMLVLGGVTAFSAMMMGAFQTVYLLEWVTVALFLGYSLLLGARTRTV